MTGIPLRAVRPRLLDDGALGRIEDGVVSILATSGIHVSNDDARGRLRSAGFPVSAAGRVTIESGRVRAAIAEERAANGNRFGQGPQVPPVAPGFTMYMSNYSLEMYDSAADRIVPFTTDRYTEAVKLADAVADRGIVTAAPGYPADAPPMLQPVLGYWIAATHARQGYRAVDPKHEPCVPFVMDMAEALGDPMEQLPVYMNSPLGLAGDSFEAALKYRDRIRRVHVTGMPSPGVTAPVNPGDALAMGAAESMGGAILMRELTGLPAAWSVCIFPADFRTLGMVFGSPENFLFHLLAAEVNAYLQGLPWWPAAGNIHTQAKRPGAQACAEKSSIMTAGAMLGQDQFGGAGALSLDEVFSPEQLLLDLEVKDHAERMVAGTAAGIDAARAAASVAEGLAQGSFAGLEETMALHRDLVWTPFLFERGHLGSWRSRGEPDIRAQVRAAVGDLVRRHDWRLDAARQRAIDRILERARLALA